MARKLLRRFNNEEEYINEKCELEVYTISLVNDDKTTMYGAKKSYFVAKYEVTNVQSSTRILGDNFNINQINKMFIDDIEVDIVRNYMFNVTRRTYS